MRSTTYRFGQVWLVSVSLSQLTVTALQLSVATTELISGTGTLDTQLTVRFVGQPLIVGGSLSTTITCWVQLLEVPQPSVDRCSCPWPSAPQAPAWLGSRSSHPPPGH